MNSSNDLDVLLAQIPVDGETISNKRLMEALHWESDRYYAVRDSLIDAGSIQRWTGRGGTVRRIVDDECPQPFEQVTLVDDEPDRPAEEELYEPMRAVLQENWVKDKRFSLAVVEQTARQGRRQTGGRWTRPDLVVVALSTFRYLPDRQFDLITFEIKPSDAVDVTAIYEAIAHLRAATMAYVLYHSSDLCDTDELVSEAQRHGIGLIAAENPSDYLTWTELVEPLRRVPDRHRLDEFVATQLSEATRNRIIKDFR